MKRSVMLVLIFVLFSTTMVFARDFSKTFSVSGGSPRQLSSTLITAGYQGNPDQVHSITICVPSANVNTLYVGQSNVSASNGFPVPPGACNTISATGTTVPIQLSGIFVFLATTENISFQLHGQ